VGVKISIPYSMHGSGVSSGEAKRVSCRISDPTWRIEEYSNAATLLKYTSCLEEVWEQVYLYAF
jgi:hypothetical protein